MKVRMAFSTRNEEELQEWMESQDFPEDVLESFKGELGSAIFLP